MSPPSEWPTTSAAAAYGLGGSAGGGEAGRAGKDEDVVDAEIVDDKRQDGAG
ncbi:hypothetical protein [Streptomyces swartbergensis]|uniref:hypothetical protein n=1 Tax=Streptomyces swartbergensis TaxID=487165 RepID=UPI003804EEB6